MKKWLCWLILFTIFSTVPSLTVGAAQGSVIFDGNAESFVVLAENKDLFTNLKGVYPGDRVSQSIDLRNDSDTETAIYLRARTVRKPYRSVLQKMSLRVYDTQGRCVSHSSAAEQGGIAKNVLIAKLKPNEQQTMALHLVVDNTMGNEFQNSKGLIEWVFTAEKEDNPKVNTAFRNRSQNSTPANRGVLGAFYEFLPQTGDTGSTVVGILSSLTVISAVVFGLTVRLRKSE